MDRRDFKKVASEQVLNGALMKAGLRVVNNKTDSTRHPNPTPTSSGIPEASESDRMKLKVRDLCGVTTTSNVDKRKLNTLTHVINRQYQPRHNSERPANPNSMKPSNIPNPVRQQRNTKKKSSQKPVSRINIHNYRPDYNWNRGGRVKELRIRCVARKFLFLWIRKVFGRVTLSRARDHYNQRIVKLTFSIWYDLWWELRKEWRLTVRAECNHRYILWTRVLNAWKEFVQRQRLKKKKFFTAQKYYILHCEKKVLYCWLQYISQRRRKRLMVKVALTFRQHQQKRTTWVIWQRQQSLTYERQDMDMLALNFWAFRVQVQHWLIWQEALQQRYTERKKLVCADQLQYRIVMMRGLRAWVTYVRRRRDKKQIKEYAVSIYRETFKLRILRQWRRHLGLRRSLVRHQDYMLNLACRFTVRKFMERWKIYISHVKSNREKIIMADQHHKQRLLSIGFNSFQLYVVQQRLQNMRQHMACQHLYRKVTRHAWNFWLSKCESNEELKMMPLTRIARKHYNSLIVMKGFQALLEYSKWRRHRQSEYHRADAHHYLHIMPQCLFQMKVFVHMERNIRENKVKAADFRRECVYAHVFTHWQTSAVQSRENRMLERMAILHNEDTTVYYFFNMWKARTIEKQETSDKLELASEHYRTTIRLRYLHMWKSYVDDLRHRELQEVKAIKYNYLSVMRKHFLRWKTYRNVRQQRHRLTEKSLQHLKVKLLRRAVVIWRSYVTNCREINSAADARYASKCRAHLSWALHIWRQNVGQQRIEKQHEHLAHIHHNRNMLVKVLRIWHRFAAIHAYKKSEARKLENEARVELENSKLRVYFSKWCQSRDARLLMRLKWQRAVCHHERIMLDISVCRWKNYLQLKIRKNLLLRQSIWFLKVRLQATTLLVWKERMLQAEDEKQKTGLALWNWSQTLCRKSLITWYMHGQERKRKKQRIVEALERRRIRLLRNGIAQWLTVANDFAGMRAKFAAQQQAQSMFSAFQKVQKCALHWKYWAARRREVRGGPAPLPVNHPAHVSVPGHYRENRDLNGANPQSSVPNFEMWPNVLSLPVLKQVSSPVRSVTRTEFGQGDGPVIVSQKERSRPRKPAFLIESLKRAGLYSSIYDTSDSTPPHDTLTSSPVVGHHQAMQNIPDHSKHSDDISLEESAQLEGSQVKSISAQGVPITHLHLSNVSDAEFSPLATYILPSCSTQRSPPPDFSSHVSAVDRHHKPNVRWKGDILDGNLDHHPPAKPCLMRPEDFLRKSDGSEVSAARTVERVSFDSSQNRYYLDTSSDKMSDIQMNVSCMSGVKSLEVNMSPAEELVNIRDNFREFEELKKKLRRLATQHKQLSGWLDDQGATSDQDIIDAQCELKDMTIELKEMQRVVGDRKKYCQQLVERVNILVKQVEAAV